MYKFLQRNNKKLLAVFAAFLMIVFILPTTMGRMGGEYNPVFGHIGTDTKLHAADFRNAKEDWDLLSRLQMKDMPFSLPFILTLAPPDQLMMALQSQRMPPSIAEINEHPELFLLLQKEAQQMGVQVSRDRLEETLRNQVQIPPGSDVDFEQRVRRALHGFLLVKGGYERAASVVKISEPMRRHGIAEHFQTIKLDVVEIPATDFKPGLPEPTSEQLQEQFKKYAEFPPGMHDPENNPMGFGYQFPNRVKVQYISISREEVRKAVEKSKSDYEWKVQAYEYYSQNKHQFPSTQPATQPVQDSSMNIGASPTTATTKPTASTTRPITRPFEEVREEVMTRLVRTEADQLTQTIQDRIGAQLAADWVSYQRAISGAGSPGTTQPTTTAPAAPKTTLGAPYNSFEYLEKLAAKIQREHGVLPAIANVADPKSAEQLTQLPGIGVASLGTGAAGAGGTFAEYATGAAEAFVPAEVKDNPRVLSAYEPSLPLRNFIDETVYFFRLTDAQKAHKPDDPTEVLAKLKEDFAAAASYGKAKDAAEEILKQSNESNLEQAAKASGRAVTSVGPWRSNSGEVPGLTVSPAARVTFAREVIDLLKDAAKGENRNPIAIIELPQDQKVLVARLADAQASWQPDSEYMIDMQVNQQMTSDLRSLVQLGWFNYDSVVTRLNYREENVSEKPPTPAQPPPQPQPRL